MEEGLLEAARAAQRMEHDPVRSRKFPHPLGGGVDNECIVRTAVGMADRVEHGAESFRLRRTDPGAATCLGAQFLEARGPYEPPWLRTSAWSAVNSTSLNAWLDSTTVRPSSARLRTYPRNHRTPGGSRPLVGSSRTSTAGSPSMAAASPSRWRIPRENSPTRFRATSASPVSSRTFTGAFCGSRAAVARMRR